MACTRESERPPAEVSTPTPVALETSEPVSPPVVDAAPDDPRTPIGNWGVELFVPEGAESLHYPDADRHSIRLSENASVGLVRVASAARTERTDGDQERNVRVLERGTTPDGFPYTILSFSVRVGVPSPTGKHLHTFEEVTRVYADLAIDDHTRVECTGYLEHGIESMADPDIQMLRRICLSLRLAK
jgi:hypothetical protein